MRSILSTTAVVAGVALAAGASLAQGPGTPPPVEPAVERGAQLAQDRCASCHAVALENRSPRRDAPQFRVLSRLYSRQDLARKLDDIAANGHFEMPAVALREDEMQDIAAYMSTLEGDAEARPTAATSGTSS
jgi:mono/diheme cytochrome c family protein